MKVGDTITWRFSHENSPCNEITRVGKLILNGTFHYIVSDERENKKYTVVKHEIIIVYGWKESDNNKKYIGQSWTDLLKNTQDNGGR
jgi:hypothetical protein